jgi:hypothetical protein
MFWPPVVLLPGACRLRRAASALALTQMAGFTFIGRAHIVSAVALIALPLYWCRRADRATGPDVLAFGGPRAAAGRKAA